MDKRFLALAMALMLVLAIMVSPVPGIADAGSFSGGSDYGGSDWSSSGSDWSSSDWSSSDYSSSSGGGGEWGLGTTITVAAIVIIIVIVSGRNKKGGSGSSGGSRIAGAQRTVLPMTIEDLKKQDPAFSEEKMKEKIGNLYVRMQECWQNKTWEEMRTGMDDAIFNQFNAQLNSLIKAGKTNYVDDIAVLGVDLTGFGQDDKHDIVTALVRVRIKDYTVDDATGAVVSGSKTAEKFMTYEWTMIRTKGEPGTGDVVQAVRHMRAMNAEIRRVQNLRADELFEAAKQLQVPVDLVKYVHENGKLPVVNFAAGGVATPADAALMMQLGAEGVFVGSGIFKSGNPAKRAQAIVKAVANYTDAKLIAELSEDLGEAMVGINENEIALLMAERGK